ncbi:Smr/MutS family protein [Candidatus Paracaedibacter symbiosus]|uniref:Smr/MutS family protein n=1 Tax=Candidatus Paracaedibacter symbiosus TaxID=244582 RepID=UPI00068D1426|nr:Smr/MutS family protein [Candidatus Paracaedibacter symbiosus]
MAKKPLDESEMAAWQAFIDNVKPLDNQDTPHFFVKRPVSVDRDRIHQQRRREYYEGQRQILLTDHAVSGSTHKTTRVTKVVIEARIDLHGFTKDQAQQQLQFFLMNAQLQYKNWVLVITGKGKPDRGVTLRSLVPGWLDNLPYVSAYAPAKPHDGGTGALYVRLKKLRD